MDAEVRWAQGLEPRRKGAALLGAPPSQHCCAAAASFLALRCHCWKGFGAAQVGDPAHYYRVQAWGRLGFAKQGARSNHMYAGQQL